MEKKINTLTAAYAAKDGAKLRKAAEALVAYARANPFALCGAPGEWDKVTALAKRIVEAPALPF